MFVDSMVLLGLAMFFIVITIVPGSIIEYKDTDPEPIDMYAMAWILALIGLVATTFALLKLNGLV